MCPTWTVVVVGDVCRSPRMCYHALSLADKGARVNLVGYYEGGGGEAERRKALGDRIGACGDIRPIAVCAPPDFVDSLPTAVLRYGAKMLWTFVALLVVLLRTVPSRSSGILLQNPPGLPAMAVCWLLARCKSTPYFVDWHNYTYTMLQCKMASGNIGALSVDASNLDADWLQVDMSSSNEETSSSGDRSKSRNRKRAKVDKEVQNETDERSDEKLGLLPRVAQKLERHLALKADGHLCVSRAMRDDLAQNWSVRAVTLYDRPPRWRFSSASLEERHAFLCRLATELMYPPFVCTQTSDDEREANRFTYRDSGSGKVRTRGLGRPALLLSSTSWTADENFLVLLWALKLYDDAVRKQKQQSGGVVDVSTRLPHIVMVITGKGPLKETYMRLANELDLEHVEMLTPWLKSEDYPRMLQVADLGVCLHTSTSGLDLPMKVVDMHGCGLPALCHRYRCIGELVAENETGATFGGAGELAGKLLRLLRGFPESSKELTQLRKSTQEHSKTALCWEDMWDATVWPLLKQS